jgi:hypothetical protein
VLRCAVLQQHSQRWLAQERVRPSATAAGNGEGKGRVGLGAVWESHHHRPLSSCLYVARLRWKENRKKRTKKKKRKKEKLQAKQSRQKARGWGSRGGESVLVWWEGQGTALELKLLW